MLRKSDCLYTPYYCEENIWQLASSAQDKNAQVAFISNANYQCALWHQRTAGPGEPVIWDYHVVLLIAGEDNWRVYDFDTLLPWGSSLTDYLDQTFNPVPLSYQPKFRLVSATEFIAAFCSDRRHMKNENDKWLQPPPLWSPIVKPAIHNLPQYIAMDSDGPGLIYNLDSLRMLSR